MSKYFFVKKEDIKKQNQNWPEIFDHPYRILIVAASGFEKKQMHYLI